MARNRTRRTAAAAAQFDHMESAILVSGVWLFGLGTLLYIAIGSML